MRRKFSSEDRIWFTSDTHFGHKGILFRRPPAMATASGGTTRMDSELVRLWNSVVQPQDHVFHLGDVSFHKPEGTLDVLASLNGIKYLIEGNHDRHMNVAARSMFDGGVEHYHEITVGGQLIVMGHFPFRSWNGMRYNSWNLHGHCHGSMRPQGKQLDVGVDTHEYTPWSFAAVADDMSNKKFEKTDHHDARKTTTTETLNGT